MRRRRAWAVDRQDRRLILRALGFVLLLAGVGCAFLGPIELYVFYLFSEGGRFFYEGFGFGSFMFGNIALQVAGYYLIGAVLIPLGYGHVQLRRWARSLALALLWTWVLLGLPLLIVLFFIWRRCRAFPWRVTRWAPLSPCRCWPSWACSWQTGGTFAAGPQRRDRPVYALERIPFKKANPTSATGRPCTRPSSQRCSGRSPRSGPRWSGSGANL